MSIRSHMYLYVFLHSIGLQGFPCICVHIDRLHIWPPLDLLQKNIYVALRATVNSEEFGVLKSFKTLEL